MQSRFVNLSSNFRLSGAPQLSFVQCKAHFSRPIAVDNEREVEAPVPDVQAEEDEDWNSGDFGGWPVLPINLD